MESLENWWLIVFSFMVCSLSIIIYRLNKQCRVKSSTRMKDKIVMITGSSEGVGLETAIELVGLGAHLIFVCKKITNGVKAVANIIKVHPKASVDLRTIDISILSEVEKLVVDIGKKYKKIDVLINTGEICVDQYKKTHEGYNATLALNFLGPFVLTHLLLPLLNYSSNGRVINVSTTLVRFDSIKFSELSSFGDGNLDGMLGKSKLALVLSTYHLAKLLKNTNITVNVVNPNLIKDTGNSQYLYMKNVLPTKWNIWTCTKNPQDGCKAIVYAASEPNMKNISGKYFCDEKCANPLPSTNDDLLAKQMYELGCMLCQMDGEVMVQNIEKTKKVMECQKRTATKCFMANK